MRETFREVFKVSTVGFRKGSLRGKTASSPNLKFRVLGLGLNVLCKILSVLCLEVTTRVKVHLTI